MAECCRSARSPAKESRHAVVFTFHIPPSLLHDSHRYLQQARAVAPRALEEYNAARFFEYVFYPPLYLAGPTLTFNAFASQQRAHRAISAKQVNQNLARRRTRVAGPALCLCRAHSSCVPGTSYFLSVQIIQAKSEPIKRLAVGQVCAAITGTRARLDK